MSRPETISGVDPARRGRPGALGWRADVPVPQRCAGQVLIKVLAAGMGTTDIIPRMGSCAPVMTRVTEETDHQLDAGGRGGLRRFARIKGGDLCGRILAQGADVTCSKLGQRIPCQRGVALHGPAPHTHRSKTYPLRNVQMAQQTSLTTKHPGTRVPLPWEEIQL